MATITVNSTPQISVSQTGTGILSSVVLTKNQTFKSIFSASGTLLDQCDLLHMATYTFSVSTPQTIDLKALTDVFAGAVAFVKVRLIAFKHNGTVDSTPLLVGGAAATEWTGLAITGSKIKIFPSSSANDGYAIFTAPNTVGMAVGASDKSIKMDPGSFAYTVDLIIAGTSA